MSDDYVDRGRLALEVRDWIERGREVGNHLRAIVLSHDGHRHPLDTYEGKRLITTDADSDAVDDFCEKIARKLEGDAEGWNGTSETYYVEACFGSAPNPGARLTFTLARDSGGREKRGRTEKPNEQGLIAAAMRLAENGYSKINLQLASYEKSGELANRRYEKLLDENGKLREELSKIRAQMDQMLTDDQGRKIALEEWSERKKMLREIFVEAKTYLPVIANRIAVENGKDPIFPQSELGPEQRLLRELVRQMDQGEFKMMFDAIASKYPTVGLMLAELVVKVQDEDARRAGISMEAQRKLEEARAAKEAAPAAASDAPKLNGHAQTKALEAGPRGSEIVPRSEVA